MFNSFFVRRTRTTVSVLFTSLSLCVAGRNFAFPSHYLHIRRAAAPSVIAFYSYVFAERFLPHLRRVATISLCVAQPSRLIESRYLVFKLRIICYRAVRRGLDRTPAPRQSTLPFFFIFLSVLIAGPAASLPRSKSARLCCLLLANNEKRSRLLALHRLPLYVFRRWRVWRVPLGTRHGTSLPGTSHLCERCRHRRSVKNKTGGGGQSV